VGEKGHSYVVGVMASISWKILIMFNNFVAISALSPLLLQIQLLHMIGMNFHDLPLMLQ
jgi:hypothetical protein